MKKFTPLLLTAAHLIAGTAFATSAFQRSVALGSDVSHFHESENTTPYTVVDVQNLTTESLREIMDGISPNTAVAFPLNTRLPITFFLNGDLVELVDSQDPSAQIEVKQTFYGRFVNDTLLFSLDLSAWKPFFEFLTGSAGVALIIEADSKPSLIIGADLNHRE